MILCFGNAIGQTSISVEKCPTIDKELTQKCRELMMKVSTEHQLDSVEAVVLETQKGQVKAWLSVKKESDVYVDGTLWKESCSSALMKPVFAIIALNERGFSLTDSIDTMAGEISIDGMILRDHNWRKGGYGWITYQETIDLESDIGLYRAIREGYGAERAKNMWMSLTHGMPWEINPGMLIMTYNSFAHDGKVMIPDLESGEVEVEEDKTFSPSCRAMIRKALTFDKNRHTLHSWLDADKQWLAATARTKVTEKSYELAFCGYFPVTHPRYTICVIANKTGLPAGSKQLSGIVNPLAEWLSKRVIK